MECECHSRENVQHVSFSMLEWLVTIGATELGKAVFEQGLKLTQAAAEDYVKGLFQGLFEGRRDGSETGGSKESGG